MSAGDDLDAVALEVVVRATEGRDSLVIVTGENAPDLGGLLRAIGDIRPDLEPDVLEGGQPHYPLLVVAE